MFSIFKNDVSKRFPLRRGIRGRMFPSDYGIFFSIFSFFFYQKYTLSSRASEGSEGSSASALFILILFLTLIPCFDLQFSVFSFFLYHQYTLSSRASEGSEGSRASGSSFSLLLSTLAPYCLLLLLTVFSLRFSASSNHPNISTNSFCTLWPLSLLYQFCNSIFCFSKSAFSALSCS